MPLLEDPPVDGFYLYYAKRYRQPLKLRVLLIMFAPIADALKSTEVAECNRSPSTSLMRRSRT